MKDLPTVELVEGAYYWVKHRYENPDLWTVARWEVGYFWGVSGNEFSPRIISGPIPRPVQRDSASPLRSVEDAPQPREAPDEQMNLQQPGRRET